MITAAVRDLKRAHPEYSISVDTTAMYLWENNPHLSKKAANTTEIKVEYPLIHTSNGYPWHFIHGPRKFLEKALELDIPAGGFCCDLHLTSEDRTRYKDLKPYWLIDAGYKEDFTLKMWSVARYQEVIDATKDTIHWIQIGSPEHNHTPLRGVTDMRGMTPGREIVRLMYRARGVLTPVSFPMHLATMQGHYGHPPMCAVIAGGREPSQWEAYGNHQFIHRCGLYPCNRAGGCWNSKKRTDPAASADRACSNLLPDSLSPFVVMPRCMYDISVDEVVDKVLALDQAV